MAQSEFVIVFTQHRFFGNVFLPYLIQKEDKFYSTIKLVKPHDLKTLEYHFQPYEKELVEMIDKYSDERLLKRFSRAKNVTEFFAGQTTAYFEKHISPFIEQCMFEVVKLLMLSPVRLLNKEVKYANLYDEDEIHVPPFFAHPVFYFDRSLTETRYWLKIILNGKEISLLNRNIRIITNSPCLFVYRNQLIAFEKLDSKKILPFLVKENISIPGSIEDKYYSGFVRKTIRDYEVKPRGFLLEEGEEKKQAVFFIENNLKMEPCLNLNFYYGNEKFPSYSNRDVAVHFQKTGHEIIFKKIKRNFKWEKNVLLQIKELGLQERDGCYYPRGIEMLNPEEAVYFLINWLNNNKLRLEEFGITVEQEKLNKKYFTGYQHLEMETRKSGDWFDVYAIVNFGGVRIPFIKLKNHILNDIREFELPDGEIAIIPEEWFTRFKNVLPFAKKNGEKMQFENYHYTLLQPMIHPDDALMKKLKQLSNVPKNVKLPENLKARLRGYQKEGFRWMFGLHNNGFGGCLADDMGLGKTLQTLTLLLKVKRPEQVLNTGNVTGKNGSGQLELFLTENPDDDNQAASLIVLPTSLVHNWEAEIKKFTPSLKVYKHVGQQRKSKAELEKAGSFFDVILTTYGTVRNDADALSKIRFLYLILDESQYVKNPLSKTYKSVMKLQGDHRLVLTGTPIENSLSDLWAQMNFLNKGMLGNLTFFRRNFITPIEKYHKAEEQEKLQLMIHPFVLRRTKEAVASDLPPLTEQVVVCEMEAKQHKLYESEKSVIRNSILEGIEQDGVKKSAMVILKGLSRLRQLANHPLMLKDLTEGNSGKFVEIFRMLENVVAEKHKVLVFSSFVKHLNLIRNQMEKMNWKFSMLTGKTTNREQIIREFQDDPENHVFLISLKAGGVGINLTSADYVFLIDPWWNPAAEMQAVSRSHRIGQNKKVFVYRFITQNSIEEKIQQLQERKNFLANKFINSNNPLQEISKEEIIHLFK